MEARMLDSSLHLKSFVGMQARAASVGRVLYGYYHVPDRSSKPIDFIINPEGMEERAQKRCGPPLWKSCILSARWHQHAHCEGELAGCSVALHSLYARLERRRGGGRVASML